MVWAAGAANPSTQLPQESAFPQFPIVNLAKPKNADAVDLDKSWEDRVRTLVEGAMKAEPLDKARIYLAAANIVLGRQLEPYCSQRMIGIPEAIPGAGTPKSHFDRFDELLVDARQALALVQDADPQLAHIADLLETLGGAQKALLLDHPAADRRRSASALARLLEDSNKQVAECARLWQVLLRTTEDDPSFALQVLDNPMVPPSAETWPYGLFSKVLRCRFQALQGRWSSALVMLSHIEEQLDQWVPDLAHRGDARRFFAYIRFETLKRWHDALPPEQATERDWCRTEAEDVAREYFSVDASILRLDPAVPLLLPEAMLEAGGLDKPGNNRH